MAEPIFKRNTQLQRKVSEGLQPRTRETPTLQIQHHINEINEYEPDDPNAISAQPLPPPRRQRTADQRRRVNKEGRKRKLQPEKHLANIAKLKRNSGESYASHYTKKRVLAKTLGMSCGCPCWQKLNDEQRNEVFSTFWSLKSYNSQQHYVQGCIDQENFERKRKIGISTRPYKYTYKVRTRFNNIQVCRKAFISLHGIGDKRLRLLLQKLSFSSSGQLVNDMRGQQLQCRRSYSEDSIRRVHEYIVELPTTASHHTRQKAPHCRYILSSTKHGQCTVKKIYINYFKWMLEHNYPETVISQDKFSRLFREDYNIKFKGLRTDVCTTCYIFKIQIDDLKKQNLPYGDIQEMKSSHLKLAAQPKKLLKKAEGVCSLEELNETRCIAVDLQQTLPCPRLHAGTAFFKRKLWLYNFCIYDCTYQIGNMYVWDETTAGRGSVEIASAIIKWIKREEDIGRKFFTTRKIFCDNCKGQNKNIFIVLMALQLVHQQSLKRVEIIFMISGHSYMPCDRAFGSIENLIRKQKAICSVNEYLKVIKDAANPPFPVTHMKQSDFKKFKLLQEHTKKVLPPKTGFSTASQFVVDEKFPIGFFIKTTYDSQEIPHKYSKVRLMKGRTVYRNKEDFDLSNVILEPAYDNSLLLCDKKVEDLVYFFKIGEQ